MNHASLFSGIGGFDLAAREVGWNNVFQCEIDLLYDKEDDKKQRSTENRLFKKYACRDWDGRGSTQWKSFPTQSPICRGNDGLPFNVDNLTIPYGKWRKESIKAYGNAIVPLIAVKIFEMINKIEGYEQQTTL